MSAAVDPYAPPRALGLLVIDPAADARRRELLVYEAAYLALGLACAMAGLGMGGAGMNLGRASLEAERWLEAAVTLPLVGFGWLAVRAGWDVLRMDARSRRPALVLAGLLLGCAPVGTGLGAWLLRVLRAEAAAEVLTEEHRALQDATPHLDGRCVAMVCGLLAWAGAAFVTGVVAVGLVV